ncbi:hypothetical protein DFJ73DRAFT_27399 [Zopfochytrium polystomum]|nr:hypothetical protein DFJ73DRAFT_27399 [Zopfochytrium polystomum]
MGKGGAMLMDPMSLDALDGDEDSKKFLEDEIAKKKMAQSLRIAGVNPVDFDAVIYPEELLMNGFPHFPTTGRPSPHESTSACGIISAVCHGRAVLVNVKLSSGQPLLAGKRATGTSDAEEIALGRGAARTALASYEWLTRCGIVRRRDRGDGVQSGEDYRSYRINFQRAQWHCCTAQYWERWTKKEECTSMKRKRKKNGKPDNEQILKERN